MMSRFYAFSSAVLVTGLMTSASLGLNAAESDGEATALSTETALSPETAREVIIVDADLAAQMARAQADLALVARAARSAIEAEADIRTAVIRPQITATGSYTYRGDRPKAFVTGVGLIEQGLEEEYRGAIRGEQLLWSFGRISAAFDASDALNLQSEADLEQALREVAFRARLAVASIQLANAQLEVAKERVAQRRSELDDAEARRQAGDVTELDVRQARLALIESENQLRAETLELDRAHHELATAIAIEDAAIEVPNQLQRPQDLDALLSSARAGIETGPSVRALQAQAALRQAQRAEARGSTLPELRAFGEYGIAGEEIDDTEDQWAVGLSLSWSLYDGGADLANMDLAAREAVRAQRLAIAEVRERRRDYQDLAAEASSLDSRISAATEAVDLAAANYEDARAQYRAGVITQTRVGDANLEITIARINLLRLIFNEIATAENLRLLIE